MKQRDPVIWEICIETYDKMPREARLALQQSVFFGTCRSGQGFNIAKAPGRVMAERIKRADKYFQTGSNADTGTIPISMEGLNDILCGADRVGRAQDRARTEKRRAVMPRPPLRGAAGRSRSPL